MRAKKFNASSPSLGTCHCSVKSQSSFWFLPSLSKQVWVWPTRSPRKPQWVWPHPWAPSNTLLLGPLFREWEGLHCGEGVLYGFPRPRVLLSGAQTAGQCPAQRFCGPAKLWKSSAVCVCVCGGRGQRRRLVQVLLIGEGFMIFTMCLVPCLFWNSDKDGKENSFAFKDPWWAC